MLPFYVSCAHLMGFQQSYEHWNDGDSNPEHIFWNHSKKSLLVRKLRITFKCQIQYMQIIGNT